MVFKLHLQTVACPLGSLCLDRRASGSVIAPLAPPDPPGADVTEPQ